MPNSPHQGHTIEAGAIIPVWEAKGLKRNTRSLAGHELEGQKKHETKHREAQFGHVDTEPPKEGFSMLLTRPHDSKSEHLNPHGDRDWGAK